jgi:hypothetical protein
VTRRSFFVIRGWRLRLSLTNLLDGKIRPVWRPHASRLSHSTNFDSAHVTVIHKVFLSSREASRRSEVIGSAQGGLTTCIGELCTRTPWPATCLMPPSGPRTSPLSQKQDEQHPEFQYPTSAEEPCRGHTASSPSRTRLPGTPRQFLHAKSRPVWDRTLKHL